MPLAAILRSIQFSAGHRNTHKSNAICDKYLVKSWITELVNCINPPGWCGFVADLCLVGVAEVVVTWSGI